MLASRTWDADSVMVLGYAWPTRARKEGGIMIVVKLFLLWMVLFIVFENFVERGNASNVVQLVVFIAIGGWLMRGEMKKWGWVKKK